MDPQTLELIAKDTEELTKLAREGAAAIQKVAGLESTIADLNSKLEASQANVSKYAEAATDFFVSRGVLPNEKKASFFGAVSASPEEFVKSFERYEDSLTVKEAGGAQGESKTAADTRDPIEAYALG